MTEGEALEDVEEVVDYSQQHPETFAGSYFERAGHRKRFFSVLFTADIAQHAAALRAITGHPDALRFYLADTTIDELRSLQRRINEDLLYPDPDPGPNLAATGISVEKNVVTVSMRHYERRAANRIQRRYGPRVCVEVGDVDFVLASG